MEGLIKTKGCLDTLLAQRGESHPTYAIKEYSAHPTFPCQSGSQHAKSKNTATYLQITLSPNVNTFMFSLILLKPNTQKQ